MALPTQFSEEPKILSSQRAVMDLATPAVALAAIGMAI
jgi:hypothetical protein